MAEVSVRIYGFSRIDYDKKPIRKALRLQGIAVRNYARALVSRRGVSEGGAAPGLATGLLRRSIRSKVLRSGLAVVIEPNRSVLEAKRGGGDDAAYPWILVAGVAGTRLRQRKDYMQEALNRRSVAATDAIGQALAGALVPRK